MTAVSKGHLECARELLEMGADPDLSNSKGYTPLMQAGDNNFPL